MPDGEIKTHQGHAEKKESAAALLRQMKGMKAGRDRDMGPGHGTRDRDMGPGHGTGIWNRDTGHGTGIWDRDTGHGTGIWDRDTGIRFCTFTHTPGREDDVKTENETAMKPEPNGSFAKHA
ncbi:hypothetical protein EYF80_047207 [Liparis tanakae]|uniref:Uncharacterized protein n=1 Tax=Liparis tanakae TaxID=230148 RepID=A0A4Z2FP90_9TELE|nr:hypothetical protein EYF80_047207 [Liparis tanakae]